MATRPNWHSDHPPTCTCADCHQRRGRNRPNPKPFEPPRPGWTWQECQTCNATGWIISRWTTVLGGQLTRCPGCQKRGWIQVHAEDRQARQAKIQAAREAQANDILKALEKDNKLDAVLDEARISADTTEQSGGPLRKWQVEEQARAERKEAKEARARAKRLGWRRPKRRRFKWAKRAGGALALALLAVVAVLSVMPEDIRADVTDAIERTIGRADAPPLSAVGPPPRS